MEYEVNRSITGKWQVHYECPQCGEALVNELADAGQRDTCPNCAFGFEVPGQQVKQQVEREQRESIRQRQMADATRQLQQEEKEATRAVERALAEVDEVDRQRAAAKRERVRVSAEVLATSHGPIGMAIRFLETALTALVLSCLLGGVAALALVLIGVVSGIRSGYNLSTFLLPVFLLVCSIASLVLLGAVAAILRIEKSTRAAAMAVVEIADRLAADQEADR